jgi:DNA-binding NtrC family response regulator
MPTRSPLLVIVESRNTLLLRYAESIRAAGVQVEHVVDDDQAIVRIRFFNPEVVLTDCSRGRDASMVFCQRLKQTAFASQILVVGMTSDSNPSGSDEASVVGWTMVPELCPPERLLVEIGRALAIPARGDPEASQGVDNATIERLEQMLGHVLRENADLTQRSLALEQSAMLWADWFERVTTRAKRVASGAAMPDAEANLYGASRRSGIAG